MEGAACEIRQAKALKSVLMLTCKDSDQADVGWDNATAGSKMLP